MIEDGEYAGCSCRRRIKIAGSDGYHFINNWHLKLPNNTPTAGEHAPSCRLIAGDKVANPCLSYGRKEE